MRERVSEIMEKSDDQSLGEELGSMYGQGQGGRVSERERGRVEGEREGRGREGG